LTPTVHRGVLHLTNGSKWICQLTKWAAKWVLSIDRMGSGSFCQLTKLAKTHFLNGQTGYREVQNGSSGVVNCQAPLHPFLTLPFTPMNYP